MSPLAQPKVRPLISEWVQANGDLRLALRDPDELIEGTVFVSPALAPVLELCDGTHSLAAIQAALTLRYGLSLPTARLVSLIQQLDEALLLESERAETARRRSPALRTPPTRTSFRQCWRATSTPLSRLHAPIRLPCGGL
ncbi:MAG: hypothetical protein OXE05_05665 [Chloroflexi bacterium]|nr:hypothetical protein [Chloroflexota bacterium]